MPVKVKILDTRKVPSGVPERVGKFDQVVTYQIDPLHTYIVTIPAEEATEKRVTEVIAKDIKERGEWVGKEIEIP